MPTMTSRRPHLPKEHLQDVSPKRRQNRPSLPVDHVPIEKELYWDWRLCQLLEDGRERGTSDLRDRPQEVRIGADCFVRRLSDVH